MEVLRMTCYNRQNKKHGRGVVRVTQEEYLSELIAKSGLSLKQFAEKCGVPRTNLYNWRANMNTMPVSAVKSITRALSITPNELLQVDWTTAKHVEELTEEEFEVLEKYRNDAVTREFIQKIVR